MNLNERMEFDCVVQIHDDGTVTDRHDLCAPELYDNEIDGDRWEFFTTGYSSQDSYTGPIMHNSEFIGGRLARDILATPGVYAVIASMYSPDEDGDEWPAEGWAVVNLIES